MSIINILLGLLLGTLYRHHKGSLYRKLGDGCDSTNVRAGCPVVIYRSIALGVTRVREASEWNERVQWPDGTMQHRFERIGVRDLKRDDAFPYRL